MNVQVSARGISPRATQNERLIESEQRTVVKKYDANTGKMVESDGKSAIADQQRAERRRNRGNADKADWSGVDAGKLVAVVASITRHGFAIRFGYTRDGGAFAIGIIGDGEPFTEFVRPSEDIDLYLDGLISDYGK